MSVFNRDEENFSDFVDFELMADRAVSYIEHNYLNIGNIGLTTGIDEIDTIIGKMRNGELIVLAGRPGMGKSALAMDIARGAASSFISQESEEKSYILFFSLEMTSLQLTVRLLSSQSGVNTIDILTGKIDEYQLNIIRDSALYIKSMPILICDRGSCTITDIKGIVNDFSIQYKPSLIIVDYIQKIQPRYLNNERENYLTSNTVSELSFVSHTLKEIAKSYEVPVLACSQLNRNSEGSSTRAGLADLKGSGAIEQDADIVMILYRHEQWLSTREPEETEKDYEDKHFKWKNDMEKCENKANLYIPKNRHGPPGKVELRFDKRIMRFSSLVD